MTQRQEFIERFVASYLVAVTLTERMAPIDARHAVQAGIEAWRHYTAVVTREMRQEYDLVPLEAQRPKVPDAPPAPEDEAK